MNVGVRFHGLESSEALRSHVDRKLRNHLSRFQGELSSVMVRLSDLNGPKGGVDKVCKVTVRGARLRPLSLSEVREDAYAAVDLALERVAYAVAQELARARRVARRAARNAPPGDAERLTG